MNGATADKALQMLGDEWKKARCPIVRFARGTVEKLITGSQLARRLVRRD